MKLNTITKIAGCAIALTGIYSCQDGDEFFAVERYEKKVYIVSEKDNNIFTAEYELTGEEEAMKTLPFAVSGSNPIDEDVHLIVEHDPDFLLKYNETNFLDEKSKYAHELGADDYSMSTQSVDIKAGVNPGYEVGKLPIVIREKLLEQLSVDSAYFISFRIKEATPYPVIDEKKNVLYRVFKKNIYAQQKKDTYYNGTGYVDDGYFNTSKKMWPLSHNAIRAYVGAEVFTNEDTEKIIIQKAMRVTVDANNKLTVSPFKSGSTLKVETLTPSDDPDDMSYGYRNEYNPEEQRFYLYYRYDMGQGWKTVREMLTSEEAIKQQEN